MDTYLKISEATKRYKITENLLNNLIGRGRIRAANMSGSVIVNAADVENSIPKDQRPEYKKFAHLAGCPIGVREASRKYNIPDPSISRWAKAGLIRRLGQAGRKVHLDEQDVAYCAEIYHQNKGGQGKWLFRDDGTPYVAKNR